MRCENLNVFNRRTIYELLDAPNLPHIPLFKPLLGSLYMCVSSNSHPFLLVFVLKNTFILRRTNATLADLFGLRRYSSHLLKDVKSSCQTGMHIFKRYVVENKPALLTQDDHPLLGGRRSTIPTQSRTRWLTRTDLLYNWRRGCEAYTRLGETRRTFTCHEKYELGFAVAEVFGISSCFKPSLEDCRRPLS
jgi:hypothetical protein